MIAPEAVVLLLLVIVVTATLAVRSVDAKTERSEESAGKWKEAVENENSEVGRVLLAAARPVAALPAIRRSADSPTYTVLRTKLFAAGGLYGRSVEVFLSVQVFAMFLGALIIAFLVAADVTGLLLYGGGAVALMFAAYPYSTVSQRAKKQAAAITHGLPEFAELLQMPLGSGIGIRASLRFTAERVNGPVSEVVLQLLSDLSSRTKSDEEAYELAGMRLGTPEAIAFFVALKQADQEGTKVSETLARQAAALRMHAYQQARAEHKKLPVKLLMVFFIHLMPGLLALGFIPTLYGLGHMS